MVEKLSSLDFDNDWPSYNPTVCADRPADYSSYTKLKIHWGSMDDYEVVHKIGRGKYSEVYEGFCQANKQKCVVKILKPVRTEKIYREVKILQTLFGGPHIVKLYDVAYSTEMKTPCLIYEYIQSVETKVLLRSLKSSDIKVYMRKLLEAIEYCH